MANVDWDAINGANKRITAGPAATEAYTPPDDPTPAPAPAPDNKLWSDYGYYSAENPQTNAGLDNAYMNLFGRPRQPDDKQFTSMTSAQYYPLLQASQEAKNYAARQPSATSAVTPTGGGGNPQAIWQQWSSSNKARQSDPNSLVPFVDYLKQQGIHATLDVRSDGLHKGIYLNGDPNQFVKLLDGYDNPIWQMGGGEGGGAQGGSGTDQNTELYVNELLARMHQLRQPVNDPLAPLYQLMAMQRIQKLQGDPYTGGEDAALTARYMNPLTQARDAELQQNKERIGARGMAPTSGLLSELNKSTNASYQGGVARGSNDLAVRAVDERQRRQQEQLSVLTEALGAGRTQRSEADQRANELIQLAAQFPGMDERRLASLVSAAGDNSAAMGASTNAMNQQANALRERLVTANDQASRDSAWGEFFGSILNNWGSIFS